MWEPSATPGDWLLPCVESAHLYFREELFELFELGALTN